jgi:steroid 5-alpha reductase family enzyme
MAQAWHDYFGMLGAAAATLLGLLFVSVSINAEVILGSAHKHSMHLAEQAFHNYIAAVIVSLVAFLPGISNTSLGLTILSLSGLYTVRLLVRFYKAMRAPRATDSRFDALRRYSSTLIGFVLLAVGGAQMTRDNQVEPIIAMGGLVLIVSATAISWQLLVRVAQTRYGAREE